jgi:hypothetical protein
MSGNKNAGRKTQRTVRTPATKCAHLRKRMEQRLERGKSPRGRGG